MKTQRTVSGNAQAHKAQVSAVRDVLAGSRVALMAAAVPVVGLAGVAAAQQPEQPGAAAPTSLEEITVTGSRIRRTTDFDTPNPTTVLDDAYLRNLGIVNVGDAVQQLPSNVSNFTPNATGNSNFFAGSTIANLRGLNPFFGSRTLTLVNNRRFVPTNQGDGVDLNFIPSILIERIDSVTGGASAAYGSGAISGVQNIFLNRTLDGMRLEADAFATSEGDGDDYHVGIGWGSELLDGRANVVVGYERQETDPVDCRDRDWCREGNGFIPGPVPGPSNVLRSDVRFNQMSYAGVFNNFIPGATSTQQADAAGTGLTTFNIGQGQSTVPFNNVVGGDGIALYEHTNLRAPVERDVFTGLFSLDLTDSTRMTIDVMSGSVETTNITGALNDNLQTIRSDNAYVLLNPGLLPALGPFGAALNKDWTSQLDSHSQFTTDVDRIALGFDGNFGDSTWTWNTYYQYGNTQREQLVADNKHLYAYYMAVDSVLVNGQPVCRVARDGFAAASAVATEYSFADPLIATGCVPINPFGTQPIPTAARNYAFGFLQEDLDYTQQVVAFDASGDISDGIGAGPFQLAAGVEYRTEKGENIGSQAGAPDYVRTDYLIQYGESFSGKVEVTEAFLELNTPLLRERRGAQLLEFNTAVRESEYKNTGLEGTTGEQRSNNFTTWKISGVYDPVEWLRFRSSRSRDSRAANFRELYYGQIIHAGGTFGYCGPAGSFQQDPCDWSLEGNVNLLPEEADTTTFGIVLTPALDNRLQIAVDYFTIDIEGAIQQANVRRVLDGCQISNLPEFCTLLVPDVPGVYTYNPATNQGIDSLRALSFNGSGYSYKGYDLSTDYTIALRDANSLNLRLIATKMQEQQFQPTPGQPFVDVVGQTGTSNNFLSDYQATAEWVANLYATWTRGPFSLTGQVRYVSSGEMNYYGITPGDAGFATAAPPLVTMDTNHVPSYDVVTLSGTYTFNQDSDGAEFQLFAAVNNLFDETPPIAAGTGFGGSANGGTNAVFFDTLGRTLRLGIRVNF